MEPQHILVLQCNKIQDVLPLYVLTKEVTLMIILSAKVMYLYGHNSHPLQLRWFEHDKHAYCNESDTFVVPDFTYPGLSLL
jgi:hypothetical protein